MRYNQGSNSMQAYETMRDTVGEAKAWVAESGLRLGVSLSMLRCSACLQAVGNI